MVNYDRTVSPFVTYATDKIAQQSREGIWVSSRLVSAASSLCSLGDAVLIHTPLALAKATVAVTVKSAELALSFFGKEVDFRKKTLKHCTGAEAISHVGKTLANLLGVGVSLAGVIDPRLCIAFNRSLGLARKPQLTKMQKCIKMVKSIAHTIGFYAPKRQKPPTLLSRVGNLSQAYLHRATQPLIHHPKALSIALATSLVAVDYYIELGGCRSVAENGRLFQAAAVRGFEMIEQMVSDSFRFADQLATDSYSAAEQMATSSYQAIEDVVAN